MPHGKSQTALHVACRLGDPHCCVALLSRGARFHRNDDDGCTALDLAVMHGHRKCVELLLAFGAPCVALHASIDVSLASVRAKGRSNERTVRFLLFYCAGTVEHRCPISNATLLFCCSVPFCHSAILPFYFFLPFYCSIFFSALFLRWPGKRLASM